MDYDAVLYAALTSVLGVDVPVYPEETEQDRTPPYVTYERTNDEVILALDLTTKEINEYELHFWDYDYAALFVSARQVSRPVAVGGLHGKRVNDTRVYFRFSGQRLEGRNHLIQTWKVF